MIFTVGYEDMTQRELRALLVRIESTTGRRCWLIDCRSNPNGRIKRGFSKTELREALGQAYVHTPGLGGRGPAVMLGYRQAARELLGMLADQTPVGSDCMLLCKEAAPGDCHRFHVAAAIEALGGKVQHLHRDEPGQDHDVISHAELARAIAHDDEYETDGDLNHVLAQQGL